MADYTNFCCRSGGSNLNAGTRTGSTTEPGTSADLTYAGGSWVQSTRVFTVASGNPSSDGVAVGDFVSIYADGSSVTGFVGRVTARDATTITVSATASSGTAPADGTGNRTLKVGGAWAGPSGTDGFPLTFLVAACTNAAGSPARVNLKNDQTYAVTAAMTHPSGGCLHFRGYASSYGDGGRAVIDGGTTGAAYSVFTSNSGSLSSGSVGDIEWKNNGATGGSTSTHGLFLNGCAGTAVFRCVFRDFRASGLALGVTASPAGCRVEECEFYGCNQSNTSGCGGVRTTTGNHSFDSCVFHDNTGSVADGIAGAGSVRCTRCVFDSNGRHGAAVGVSGTSFDGCDFYNNGADGINSAVPVYAKNCNFLKNASNGVDSQSAVYNRLVNCGFGAGTMANGSDLSNAAVTEQVGTVTYAANATPWADPDDGDFTVVLAAAKGAGRGAFLQTASGYSGIAAYPDIGAAQHYDTQRDAYGLGGGI